jgi:2-amino-4-hydroxy-6-hydroxymethyldihydropteridine diphosphokinase
MKTMVVSSQGVLTFVGVGANIAPEENIPRALTLLHAQAPIRALSTFYITPPIARPEQPDYLNGVVAVWCTWPARAFKYDLLRKIEGRLGRVRTGDRYAARPIDLDLLLYGNEVIEEPGLRVPDGDLRERPFLAAALLELDADCILPDTGQALATLVPHEARAALHPATPFTLQLKERFGT